MANQKFSILSFELDSGNPMEYKGISIKNIKLELRDDPFFNGSFDNAKKMINSVADINSSNGENKKGNDW